MQRYSENCVRAPQASRGLGGAREACCCATRVWGRGGGGRLRGCGRSGGSCGRRRCAVGGLSGDAGAVAPGGESAAVGSVGIGFAAPASAAIGGCHRRRRAYGGRGHSCAVPSASATADAKDIEHAPNLAFLAKLMHADKQQRQQHQRRAAPHRDASGVGHLACESRPHRRIIIDASDAGSCRGVGIGRERHHGIEILRHTGRRRGLRGAAPATMARHRSAQGQRSMPR